MGRYFGTNGIRGVFGEDFTLEVANDMAISIGLHLGRGPILVGYDGRHHGKTVCLAVTSALNSVGIDCAVAGLVPTPCLEYAVKKLGYAGGIMVTASHNPPEYSGLKPVAPDGVEVSREDEKIIEDIYDAKDWMRAPKKWGGTRDEPGAVQAYLDGVISAVDADAIRSAKLSVVVDAGNGAQAATAPKLCEMLGCRCTVINDEIDGDFSGRGPEPTPQNLPDLSERVRAENADIGVAFDGDGDRSIFCDENGTILTGDRSALVLARHVLEKSPGLVITCTNSGSAIEDIVAESGSRVERTRIGSVEVSRRMVPSKAVLGFEENGGFMYGRHNQVRDGCMTLALMLEMMSSGTILSGAVSALPVSHTTKDKVPCPRDRVAGVMESLEQENPGSNTGDGIRIARDQRNWVMIRPSGTEPIIRIYAEADTAAGLERAMSEYVKKVRTLTG